ncbi:hypothetical protein [Steroidobacter sp.]|uniref:hypothetical protein n=1 Tax=Steroidobacter sp. TaxID=1978227 RepID=UPI001A3D4B82|nr:hypothetical protein [Steroidobacter sp.]MBL8268410.1 hypothetical protein [Steroidobacter sp.]
MLYRLSCAVVLCLWSALALSDYAAAPKRPIDITGFWVLNAVVSDDPEAMLAKRQGEERERFDKMRRREEDSRPRNMPPPIDADAPPPDAPGNRSRGPRPWQKQQQENLLRMLGVSQTLEIKQLEPRRFEFLSAVDARRVEAGSHTQVSMPEGQLADSWVGWEGEWFVMERKVRSGPRALERFRLSKTGQLEYEMKWSGDSELAGMKIRRLYDRRTGPAPAPNPDRGPLR